MKKMLITFLAISLLLCACDTKKANNDNKDQTTSNEELLNGLYVPEYMDVIFTDLRNADITFWPGQYFYTCDFFVVSSEELDTTKVMIDFDSDIEFDYTLSEYNDEGFLDYDLLMAYNGVESEGVFFESEMLSHEDFKKVKDDLPKLYSYFVECEFAVEDEEGRAIKYNDSVINNVTVSYEGKSYSNKVGDISIDYSLTDEFESGDESKIEKNNWGMKRYNFSIKNGNKFSFETEDAMTVVVNDVKLVDCKLINNKSYEMDNLELTIKSGENSVSSKYEPGTELKIRKGSVISYVFTGKSEGLLNNCFFKANPILQFTFDVNGEKVVRNMEVSGSRYTNTTYEKYATVIDNIDIFGMYYNKRVEAFE